MNIFIFVSLISEKSYFQGGFDLYFLEKIWVRLNLLFV